MLRRRWIKLQQWTVNVSIDSQWPPKENAFGRFAVLGIAYIIGVAGGMFVYQTATAPEVDDGDRKARWQELATTYDQSIHNTERSTGVLKHRQHLLSHASGSVLEIAAGTARNLPFYTTAVRELILYDSSTAMLQEAGNAVRSFSDKHPHSKVSYTLERRDDSNEDIIVQAKKGYAEALPFADNYFDTVIDTFGLCSVDNAHAAMQEMVRVCKPGGKVLLLEHGMSSWLFPVSKYLNWRAKCHAQRWGCWWNRDMNAIVNEASKSANGRVRITKCGSFHLGTGYVYILEKEVE
eukprot:gene1518-4669_t